MPELTRRRYKERVDCWHIYFGDVQAGTIARRVGQPIEKDAWEWSAGFYPGSNPGEITHGTAAGFERDKGRGNSAVEAGLSGCVLFRLGAFPVRENLTSSPKPFSASSAASAPH